jgi:hypothetical protein
MLEIWRQFMPIAQLSAFTWSRQKPWIGLFSEPFFRIISTSYLCTLDKAAIRTMKYFHKLYSPVIQKAPQLLLKLSKIRYSDNDSFLFRDIVDITRTIAARVVFYGFTKLNLMMEDWRKYKASEKKILALGEECFEMIKKLGDLLGTHPDYSLNLSLKKLSEKAPVNPAFEQTLKGNAENSYCRTFIYELFKGLYVEEVRVYLKWLSEKMDSLDRSQWERPTYFDVEQKIIQDRFYERPLKVLAPPNIMNKEMFIAEILVDMKKIAQNIIIY